MGRHGRFGNGRSRHVSIPCRPRLGNVGTQTFTYSFGRRKRLLESPHCAPFGEIARRKKIENSRACVRVEAPGKIRGIVYGCKANGESKLNLFDSDGGFVEAQAFGVYQWQHLAVERTWCGCRLAA